MKNEQYGNGYKIVAILLQMVFLIIVIVIFSLMVSLYKRSMPGFFDIGNHGNDKRADGIYSVKRPRGKK